MTPNPQAPVLIVGGSGIVGSQAARALRRLHPALPLAIGARDVTRAAAVGRGIAIAVECLLGLGGRAAPKAGLYLPESILDAHAFVNRLQDLGVTIEEAQLRELPI